MSETTPSPRRSRSKPQPAADAPLVGVMDDAPADGVTGTAIATGAGADDTGAVTVAEPAVLRVDRDGLPAVTASSVEVRIGGIGSVDAEDVYVEWGGIGAARGESVSVEFGSIGAAMAGEARVTQGFAGAVLAREAIVEQGLVRTLIAQRVTVTRPSGVLVLIAKDVSGDVRALLDWRGALAFGAAFGLVTGVVRAARGAGRRR
jgi:hypothetical protein